MSKLKNVLIIKQYLYDILFGHCWSAWKQHPHIKQWGIRYCSHCHKHQIIHGWDDGTVGWINA